ncbi:6-phospho-3-hexuloisomerase [Pedobacter punctiformis]|uniref:6-phospho-3-hexuloisomerase n=1 Tax=Pedobacter punctiformis TaxID=3004097 RepID=A0ABT4LAZ1_9SPHI|nr:6-phospho-3-hexuloisomerase [Pedobacter sp. HCMS5-2]MCZ4245074.1 6-phospho-3-hexuloisomerase [Pedobacter sp. HCMS5-2]
MQVVNNYSATSNREIQSNLELILKEHNWLIKQIDFEQLDTLVKEVIKANHIFFCAAGRSGFAMRAAAMRFMHLGLKVYFVGETTTPAIRKGDLLIAASGSGTTGSIVKAAEKSASVGATVIAISTQTESPLTRFSTHLVVLPAAEKQDFESSRSAQYAGSLFEQFLLLIFDAVFQGLWKSSGQAAEELWRRHANLE